MMQQREARPRSYLGIDLHRAAIDWASASLSPIDQNYRFAHHDVYNVQFNKTATKSRLAFPTSDTFTLAIAHSVFTHILKSDVTFYIREMARIMSDKSYFVSTWFLFDKGGFPMMQDFQNALYIQLRDPTNAVIYDREFVKSLFHAAGLTIVKAIAPQLRGFQWVLVAMPSDGRAHIELPEDDAPTGLARPPLVASGN